MKFKFIFLAFFIISINVLQAQKMVLLVRQKPPYQVYDHVTVAAYLVNNTNKVITYFKASRITMNVYNEQWKFSHNGKPLKVFNYKDGPGRRFGASSVKRIAPGKRAMINQRIFSLNKAGKYTFSYWYKQSPAMVRRGHVRRESDLLAAKKVTPLAASGKIEVNAQELPKKVAVTKKVDMSWEEWKKFRNSKEGRKHKFKKLLDALLNPNEVYELSLSVGKIKKEDIAKIAQLTNLKALSLTGIRPDSFPVALTNLKLYNLTLGASKHIKYPQEFANFKELRSLKMTGSYEVPQRVWGLSKLIDLTIEGSNLKKVPDMSKMEALQRLAFVWVYDLEDLSQSNISKLPQLIQLDIVKAPKLENIQEVFRSPYISSLIIRDSGIKAITDDVGFMKNLSWMMIQSCKVVHISEKLGALTNLELLSIGGNTKLTKLPESLINLSKLKSLSFGNTNIDKLPKGTSKLPLKNVYTSRFTKKTKDYKILKKRLGKSFKRPRK